MFRIKRPMQNLLKAIMSLGLTILLMVSPALADRDSNSFDGNIYPIYAGNGSLVPPITTLAQSLKEERTSVIVYYLDDSSTSKIFAPVVSGIQLIWGRTIDLIPLTTDELQGRVSNDPSDPAYYWHGNIPQVVVIDGQGHVLLDQEGQVSLEKINKVISASTGISTPDIQLSIDSINEFNFELTSEPISK